MNYTEKYHLPQWKKEDRIMMEDFNAAMAGIEAGLKKTAQDAAAESAQIKAANGETERQMFERLCRLSYNQFCSAQTIEPFPERMGTVYQNFIKSGSVTGMVRMNDHLWTAGNREALSRDTIKPAFSQPSQISPSSNLCAVVFTSPYGGWLSAVWLTGGLTTATAEIPFSTVLVDQTTGTTEVNRFENIRIHGNSSTGVNRFEMGCFLHAGHQYRLEIRLTASGYTANLKLDIDANYHFELTSAGGGNPALTHRFQEPEAYGGGLFWVRHTVWGSGNGLILDWAGEQFTPYKIRTIINSQKKKVQEAEFRIKKEIPADSTVTLRLDCGGGIREYCLYDWGGILIG